MSIDFGSSGNNVENLVAGFKPQGEGGGMLGTILAGAASGLVSGIFGLVGGSMQNSANKKLNAESLKLAHQQRDDVLKQQGVENRMAADDRAFRDRQAAYQKLMDFRKGVSERLQNDLAFRAGVMQMVNTAKQSRRQGGVGR